MRAHLSRRRPASKESRRRMRERDRCSRSCPRIRRAAAARRAAMNVYSMQSASLSSSSRRWRRMRSSKMRLLMRLSSFCVSSPQRSSQSSAPAAMAAGEFGESLGARRADGLSRRVPKFSSRCARIRGKFFAILDYLQGTHTNALLTRSSSSFFSGLTVVFFIFFSTCMHSPTKAHPWHRPPRGRYF